MSPDLEQWVIYERPADHPDHFVVRRWIIIPGKALPTDELHLADTLEEARAFIPPGLTRMVRSPGDDPVIVEVWI